ncbi:E2F-associated phosphoprotein [Platysternon megacephalum]|uniref:E2F-associated phosphoprotein n=1 Tax=Platysternon megacephalum TaxID=55544 RepID=A0A4D9F0J5_9SAUR|nr:E2F-associated phosphoprotein [Platysternon megacephalum]
MVTLVSYLIPKGYWSHLRLNICFRLFFTHSCRPYIIIVSAWVFRMNVCVHTWYGIGPGAAAIYKHFYLSTLRRVDIPTLCSTRYVCKEAASIDVSMHTCGNSW